jgi:hypothetical protein
MKANKPGTTDLLNVDLFILSLLQLDTRSNDALELLVVVNHNNPHCRFSSVIVIIGSRRRYRLNKPDLVARRCARGVL